MLTRCFSSTLTFLALLAVTLTLPLDGNTPDLRRQPLIPDPSSAIKVQICPRAYFSGGCTIYDTSIDVCVDLSRNYHSPQIGSIRSLTDMGNCWVFMNPTCETRIDVKHIKVYWRLGGISSILIRKENIGSMKCFIMGRPTHLIDYEH
ncbi:hypothetical protein IQ07DRAFT_586084 [Pyrenochaeta sp. DS3sAY3a]|nr:hypothetical protein IQ07DRAFT_586084 [Pyrenochaeta sp. DS3sAY3a]